MSPPVARGRVASPLTVIPLPTCRAGVVLDSRAAARKTCKARTVAVAKCDATGPAKRGAGRTDQGDRRRKGAEDDRTGQARGVAVAGDRG